MSASNSLPFLLLKDLDSLNVAGVVIESSRVRAVVNADGRVFVFKGTVEQPNISAKAEFAKALKTGDVIDEGPNKGWVYCETAQREPFLVAPRDSGVMMWRDAVVAAAQQNAALPTMEQLTAMFSAQRTGYLDTTFNTCADGDGNWYWSSQPANEMTVHCLSFVAGDRCPEIRIGDASVRLVRPFTPA